MKIPIEISARHVHLSQRDADSLFGKNYEFKVKNQLSQPGEFSALETVSLINGEKQIDNVRIIAPIRANTQIELSKTDAIKIGINPPIRISGDIKGSIGIILKNGDKKIKIDEGVIIAKRHLHVTEKDGEKLKVKNGQKIKIKISGERALIFDEVIVRRGVQYATAVHLDTDEGNAAGVSGKIFGEIVK